MKLSHDLFKDCFCLLKRASETAGVLQTFSCFTFCQRSTIFCGKSDLGLLWRVRSDGSAIRTHLASHARYRLPTYSCDC